MEENTIDTPDRISMLPYSIVHQILSYLRHDAKSRVRMSVLSKEWFALTASCPFFYFHRDGSWRNSIARKYDKEYNMHKFYKYVEYTVSRFCEQNISAHTLSVSANIIYFEEIEVFERCVDLVHEKGLQMMDIQFDYYPRNLPPMFRLSNKLLSASSLTSLRLYQCELPASLIVGAVKFKSLRLLSLSTLPIDDGVIEYLTKGCPLLEELYLRYCYGFKRFCVKRHQNLLKVEIYCDRTFLLERIDVEAPNLTYFLLLSNKDKAPSMFLGSCKKLTTFCYRGSPLKRFGDFLSNFPFIVNVSLDLSSPVDNLKLSHHYLRRLELQSDCDLEKIVLNAPNLLLFKYYDLTFRHKVAAMSRKDSSLAKGYMKCHKDKDFDILSFLKLRRFLEKNSFFKVLELVICWKLIDVKELKLIQSPPYKLEHVELKHPSLIRESPVYVALVDAVLWCCRPRSLTLELNGCTDTSHIAKYTYEKLLQQEGEGQTKIKFVLIYFSKDDEQHFSDLNSLLKALCVDQSSCKITFIKEEGSSLDTLRSLFSRLAELEQGLFDVPSSFLL